MDTLYCSMLILLKFAVLHKNSLIELLSHTAILHYKSILKKIVKEKFYRTEKAVSNSTFQTQKQMLVFRLIVLLNN